MELLSEVFLLLYLFAGVIMDFATKKISNRWILFGLTVGFACSFLDGGFIGAGLSFLRMLLPLPLILLFIFGALGAGDIKLFMVVAIFVDKEVLLKIIVISFLLGGIGAVWKLIRTKGFKRRFNYLRSYIVQVAATGRILTYKKRIWEDSEIIHFSLYLFLAVALVLGGVL